MSINQTTFGNNGPVPHGSFEVADSDILDLDNDDADFLSRDEMAIPTLSSCILTYEGVLLFVHVVGEMLIQAIPLFF